MNSTNSLKLKWPLLVVSIIALMFSSAVVFSSVQAKSVPVKTVTPVQILASKKQVKFGLPVRFAIPAIKIDTGVVPVGLTSDGAMDSTKGPTGVGWFNLGVRPGEIGTAVIDGHSGWKGGIRAEFDMLYKLKVGDKIYVKDDKGITIVFIVRSLQTYLPNQDASAVFGSDDGKAHLNLVTCVGTWDAKAQSHSNRLVVFSDREVK